MTNFVENVEYKRHGGPWDRGSADAYYGRPARPHYFEGGTRISAELLESEMTIDEIAAYFDGYRNETGRKYL